MMRFPTVRRGFTLIELLVTMALIILLLSIAVAVSNSATLDSYKITTAGDRVSQALITAKARAARDKASRGVRLIAGADGYLRELVYIEQPEPILGDQAETIIGNSVNQPDRSQLVLKYPQRPGPAAPNYLKPDPNQCRVYLLLTATDDARLQATFLAGQPYLATSPDINAGFYFTDAPQVPNNTLAYAPAGMIVRQLQFNGAPTPIMRPDLAAGETPTTTNTLGTFQTTKFGIYPPAQPLAGEPTMLLSKNVAIDPQASSPQLLPFGQSFDILFAPSGHLVNRSDGVIALLVRDTEKLPSPQVTLPGANWLADVTYGQTNYRSAGELMLVVIYSKTGGIATKPVAEPDGSANFDPYRFAKDAIRSGL